MGILGGFSRSDSERFANRSDAGAQLAQLLAGLNLAAPVVLALPRGGVPVAAEVASALGAPLDVIVVRKIGAPGQPELALGAVAEDSEPFYDDDLITRLGLTRTDLDQTVAAERAELQRRLEHYRRGRRAHDIRNRTALVVDDGLATGSSALAAVRALTAKRPARVVVAVPVAAQESVNRLQAEADDVVTVRTPKAFVAVGHWYVDFSQTTDAEVVTLLDQADQNDARTRPKG